MILIQELLEEIILLTSATDAGHLGHERGSTPAGLAQKNYVQFANGINGDEDLGQTIIMKVDFQAHQNS